MVEVVPRIAVFVDFLRNNPSIYFHVQKSTRFDELVKIFGINGSRVVSGTVRAKFVYQPRATGCGMANVQESQLTSKICRDYIYRHLQRRTRNRILLIRRSRERHFSQHQQIENALR